MKNDELNTAPSKVDGSDMENRRHSASDINVDIKSIFQLAAMRMNRAVVRLFLWYLHRLAVSSKMPTTDKLLRGLGLTRSQARRVLIELDRNEKTDEYAAQRLRAKGRI